MLQSGVQKRTEVRVGQYVIGGGRPVVVQSMTNTDTADIESTTNQIEHLARAGSEWVRITVNNEAAAQAVPSIQEQLRKRGVEVPLIGDFHYNGHKLLTRFPDCARILAKYRINPGNVGRGNRRDEQFATMIEVACHHDKPVRIGVNWGSLDQSLLAQMLDKNAMRSKPLSIEHIHRETLITSALQSAELAESIGLKHDRIVISCKTSSVQELIAIYRELGQRSDYALHLGLTEAGLGSKGIVASTAAMSILLQEGIGDTIRVSLTPKPGGDRAKEVIVAQEILQTMGLRSFVPMVTACPGCGRTSSTYFQQLADEIQNFLRAQMPIWKLKYPGVEEMSVAVMGCVVNGPGESKHANVGISLPGSGEQPVAPVYVDGERRLTLKGDAISLEFQAIVEDYVQANYGR